MKEVKYFFYIVTRDFGFAPNPFCGYCTLACCKPLIRKRAKPGDWIIGIAGKTLLPERKILYAMEVTEKLTFNKYYKDPRFKNKKPFVKGSLKTMHGDNVYYKKGSKYFQDDCHHHFPEKKGRLENIKKDTKTSDQILISNNFYYFGDYKEGKLNDKEVIKKTKKLTRGYMNNSMKEIGQKTIQKLKNKFEAGKIYGKPINWSKRYYSKHLK